MREYGVVSPQFWIDHNLREWKVPEIKGRLKFKIPSHAALRDFVFHRDGNKCVRCGSDERLVDDHKISRKNGGSHHPDNLQTLCMKCNARKVSTEDKKFPARADRG